MTNVLPYVSHSQIALECNYCNFNMFNPFTPEARFYVLNAMAFST